MSVPPRKAVEQIKNYCERTQCRRCIYGKIERIGFNEDYVTCKLQLANPCDWEVQEERRER